MGSVRRFRQRSKILGYVSGRIRPLFIHILPVDIVKLKEVVMIQTEGV
uniref:Translation initiation factor 1 n=1 Tax=Phellodendron chinense TaxID=354508 RepID=A0A8F9R2J9_9ROSI|nr:translation initiation factor 1 [Phellodendron chinense]